jgi:hypothetical protein
VVKWQRGLSQQQYTLTCGTYQMQVWYQSAGEWGALISLDHTAISNNFFKTLMDAQIWCEERLAEFLVQSQCSPH